MMKDWKYGVLFFAATALYYCSPAQSPENTDTGKTFPAMAFTRERVNLPASGESIIFQIGDIYINGNRHTKKYIIERELSFKKGDSLSLAALILAFEKSHERLINTHLFNEAVVYLKTTRGFNGYRDRCQGKMVYLPASLCKAG